MPDLTVEQMDSLLDQVATLAARGLAQKAIREALGIGATRWERVGDAFIAQFEDEFNLGKYKGEAKIADIVFKRALGGDMKACYFYLTHVAKWTYRSEITGPDGQPIRLTIAPESAGVL